ncbi:MAG: FIST N-terminal domain-containing protein [Thiothrix sp.]
MHVVSTFYTQPTGWHIPLPDMDSPQTLVMVFGDADFTPYKHALAQLQRKYPNSVIAGCSTLAGIFNEHLLENALVVGIARFDNTRLVLAHAELNSKETSWQAGLQLAKQLAAPDLKGIIILTDGLHTQGTDLIQGMASYINPHQVNIIGGLASDPFKFQSTWVLTNGTPAEHMVCGIGFYGEKLVFTSNTQDGFKPFGGERIITRANDRILYELDGHPALQLYKEYLGAHAASLPQSALNFPLAIWNENKQHYAIRVPIAVDEDTQSLHFVADIPDGHKAQLMYGNMDNLLEGVETAARTLADALPDDRPVLAFTISCTVHKLIMGDDTVQELETIMDELPTGSQQIGCYTYGELAPTEQGGGCSLHNATMTLAVLYEQDA